MNYKLQDSEGGAQMQMRAAATMTIRLMAYALQFEKTVSKELKEIVAEELTSAAQELQNAAGEGRDKAVHEARKSLKKSRAVLRLVKPHLGNHYQHEDRRLRDVGRKLSELRDAEALIEAFNQLRSQHKSELPSRKVKVIADALLERKTALEQSADADSSVPAMAVTFSQLAKQVRRWSLPDGGFSVISLGLERAVRQGRKAMSRAERTGKPEHYHAWRKRVKDHWYHMRLLQGLWPEMLKPYVDSLRELETFLGDDHNLAVLRALLLKQHSPSQEDSEVAELLPILERRQNELHRDALTLGKRIYLEKPGAFLHRMHSLWMARERTTAP